MLVFASDLHLTDTPERSSFSAHAFTRSIEELLRFAPDDGIKEVRLVLLGDIFELLKSTKWLDRDVRPWEAATVTHRQTVREIFNGIVHANASLFRELERLRTDYGLTISYVPGNHDAPLNGPMGVGCRKRLRELLGSSVTDDRVFDESFRDDDCGVLARHGHHWDPANAYTFGTMAAGDFVVIDILARLPGVLAEHLHTTADDPELAFAHELDDVIPQTPRMMAIWLGQNTERLTRLRGRAAMKAAFGDIAKKLEKRAANCQFAADLASWWVNVLKTLVFVAAGKVDLVKWTAKLASHDAAPPAFSDDARGDLDETGKAYSCFVFGHTHVPDHRVLAGPTPRRLLNCGAWRRVHHAAETAGLAPAFATSYTGALAVIRKAGEASSRQKRYELRRFFYG